jgi:hypothetical protein
MKKRLFTLLAAGLAVVSMGACVPEFYIGHVFGPEVAPAATRVARCESSLNPAAMSPGGGNHGLFQINNVHRDAWQRVTGVSWSFRYDPYFNSVYAKHLYDAQGWRPWTCKP